MAATWGVISFCPKYNQNTRMLQELLAFDTAQANSMSELRDGQGQSVK